MLQAGTRPRQGALQSSHTPADTHTHTHPHTHTHTRTRARTPAPARTLVLVGMMLQDTSSRGSVVHSSRNSSTGALGLPICVCVCVCVCVCARARVC
jgi:hypothetical protein